jgi:hypothetical protein
MEVRAIACPINLNSEMKDHGLLGRHG